jgi:hypothetical protein
LITLGRLFRILRDPARVSGKGATPASRTAFPAL